jgi:hypothetical protein
VIYVAYGWNARHEAVEAIKSLRRHNDLPVAVVSDKPLEDEMHIYAPDADQGGRLAKLSLDRLSPFEYTAYLDADTRVHGDLSAGFAVLAGGWDMALAPSKLQGTEALENCGYQDRVLTLGDLGPLRLAWQAGVLFWRRCEAMGRLFAAWREEWGKFKDKDQGALLRALARVPVRVWCLGWDWNSEEGEIVKHRFGRARR